ncbi:hypothetical protein [Actinomadura alba]|uniref:PE family protein n=1 Tax=Actinomadura alba TaxID=406431 RepID=A0ABR7LNC8_9ACTN|nr:hypothetical protein [Actinomadura alba]MBC6466343.1 hypothetical protein [Actinomadura alba]
MAPTNEPRTFPRELPSAGQEIQVDRRILRSVHGELEKDLQDLKSWKPGTLNDLQSDDQGRVEKEHLGNYPAAQGLSQTTKNAYNQITRVYGEFITAYEGLINAIDRSASTHGEAERANTDAARNAGNGGPPSSGAQYA